MSWVCEFCSSDNEDDNCDMCFVCGSIRSEESKRVAIELIIANERRVKEERFYAATEKVFKIIHKALIIVFALAITLSLSMLVALFIKLVVSKNIDWIQLNAEYLLNKTVDIFAAIIQSQIWLALHEKLAIKSGNILGCVKEIFYTIKGKVIDIFSCLVKFAVIFIKKLNNITDNVVLVYEEIGLKFRMFISSFNSLWVSFISRF